MKNKTKKILITGGAGYVGSTLIRDALADGYHVRCLDHLVYGGKAIVGFMNHPNFEFIQGDIRDNNCLDKCLNDIDYVIHLAAIVGDKPCQVAPKSTYQINYYGTKLIAELSKKAKVKKFIFASTCSNYGISDPNIFADEDTTLNPVSLYAETKIDCERLLQELSDDKFAAVSLRFGTAYGVSFRTRFDLAVNSFAYEAWTNNEIVVFAADTWRPYIHVADMSLIIRNILLTEQKDVSGQIYNAGSTSQNYMKKEMVEMLVKKIPDLKTKYINTVDDRRDYRVSCNKLEKLIKFKPSKIVEDGFDELLRSFESGIIDEGDFEENNLDAITIFFKNNERILVK